MLTLHGHIHLVHAFDGQGVNETSRVRAGAAGLESIAREVAKEGFRHLGAASISGANEEDFKFIHNVRRWRASAAGKSAASKALEMVLF